MTVSNVKAEDAKGISHYANDKFSITLKVRSVRLIPIPSAHTDHTSSHLHWLLTKGNAICIKLIQWNYPRLSVELDQGWLSGSDTPVE